MNYLEEIFETFSKKKVLVIGDVMIDSYVFGSLKKSADVPTPTLIASRKEKRLGGAANVALNIQSLGATPILCSVVGDDYDGQTLERLLRSQGMPNKGIIRSQNRITTKKLRVLSGSQQLLRIDTEDIHPLIDLDRKALLNHIMDLIDESDLIIFEDYDNGTVHSEIIAETIKAANIRNIPIAVDPKKQNFLSYQGVTLIKPGISELESFVQDSIDFQHISSIENALSKLHETIGAANYLLSLDGGDIFYRSEEWSKKFRSTQTGVADMAGVGNAIISIAGMGLALKLEPEMIAELSNIGGGIVAQYSGVVPIKRDQLQKEAQRSEILTKYL